MTGYTVRRYGQHHIWIGVLALLSVLVLAALPAFAGKAALRIATEMAGYMALAVMWNLLAGYAGVMSIGQQAFVGVGAYALFVLCGTMGLPLIPAIIAAGLLTTLLSIPVGLILFRLNGAYFAIGTWVVAEIFLLLTAQSQTLGAGAGLSFPAGVAKSFGTATERAALFWWIALSIVLLSVGVAYLWLRSSRGLALTAMRDDAEAAAGLGVDTKRNRLAVYLLAAGVAGMVGAVLFLGKLRISPAAAYDINEWTASIIFIVVIGGLGRLEGAILGTLIFFVLRGFLADFGAWYLMAMGAIAIVVMLRMPQGIWGFLHERTGIELFPMRRDICPPKGRAMS
ncbi:branched-chain amino acid ABC transporter permease [Frigidibacter sp. SD6-1]|uniref:branched-chain amino acid ABC transporter permease n=1 Tax=Frigidibacter sp. SD6-1 TaxID=3032581 RepID=UPI0024DF793C|nr:branched-chain amino acid ABC transporter permease [Frigidibacter sp. SD6-1]